MNSGDAVVEKVMALFEGEVDADALDHFFIVAATLQGAEEFGRKSRATCQLRDAPEAAHRSDRHDSRDDGDADASQLAAFAEIVEVAVVEEKLGDDVIRAGVDLRL